MRYKIAFSALVTSVLAASVPALAQENPPIPIEVVFQIQRSPEAEWHPLWPLNLLPPVDFDPATEFAHEYDLVLITFTVADPDWEPEPPEEEGDPPTCPADTDPPFLATESIFLEWPLPPNSAPIPIVRSYFPRPAPLELDDSLDPPVCLTEVSVAVPVPNVNGPNQLRLQDAAVPDGNWFLGFSFADSEEPEPGQTNDTGATFTVINHPLDTPSNPGPVADAGADQRVLVNTMVTLDASRSFDAYNAGFDPDLPEVFDGDTLTYTWKYVSGPAVVNPQQDDPTSPLATVTLNNPSDADPDNLVPYVFEVAVSDGVSPNVSTDTVQVFVFTEFPPNEPPVANIVSSSLTPIVGDEIVLTAQGSIDPEGFPLDFFWQQTDALGNPIGPEDVADTFQPLSGVETATVRWIGTRPGTYYFRVKVTDDVGEFDVENIAITINSPTSTLGQLVQRVRDRAAIGSNTAQDNTDDDLEVDDGTMPAPLCGGGLLPVALVPFMMLLMKRRYTL
jgi:hypothetical protein